MKIIFQSKVFEIPEVFGTVEHIYSSISNLLNLPSSNFYLLSNGKKITSTPTTPIHVILGLPGGKGGFGSMLRAIGAQIEKTTNREACRDLSGRRLRDINEEQRLKKWVAQQAEREKEAKEKKKKKLEKLLEEPKYEFKDEQYEKERSALPEKVEDAVSQGLEASCSTKRKGDEKQTSVVKKKPKLWLDADLDEDISSSESESEEKAETSIDASPENKESTSKDEEHNIQNAKEETTQEQDKDKEDPANTDEVQKITMHQ